MKKIETKQFMVDNLFSRIRFQIIADEKIFGIGSSVTLMIFLSPFFIVFFICIFLQLSSTRPVVISIIIENQLVMGSITSVILIAGGFLGLRLVWQIKKCKEGSLVFWFYLVFSIGLFFIGMEKVQWGQLFFISYDPAISSNLHLQSETIIHNIQFWRKHLEIFPVTFGLAGLFGIWISKREKLSKISPSYILGPWFVIIVIISAIDLSFDFYKYFPTLKISIDELEEVIEMMVSISAFLFIWLNTRKFQFSEREII